MPSEPQLNLYLVEYEDGYETYWAEDYVHSIEQANDSHYTEPKAVYLCIELGIDGKPITKPVTEMPINNPNASWNLPK